MDEKTGSKKSSLEKELRSEKDAIVLNALQLVPENGKATDIPALIELLLHKNATIQSEAEKILYALKETAAVPYLLKALDDVAYTQVKHKVLACFWQAGLDAAPHLQKIVFHAVNGSFLDCMECYSIITELDPDAIGQEDLMESVILLKSYPEKAGKEPKTELLRDILVVLEEA